MKTQGVINPLGEIITHEPALPSPPYPLGRAHKVYVDGIDATIVAERVEYLDEYGKLITESLRDFTRKALKKRFASLDDFLRRWKAEQRKQAIVDELAAEGLAFDVIVQEVNKDLDPFDLICHVALDALLAKYADDGLLNLDDAAMLRIPPLNELGTPVQLINAFGGRDQFVAAVHDLQAALYQETA